MIENYLHSLSGFLFLQWYALFHVIPFLRVLLADNTSGGAQGVEFP